MRALTITLLIVLLLLPSVAIAQDVPDFLVEAFVDNTTPYIGQQISYIFKLYIRSGRTNRGSTISPSFEGFWRQNYGTIVESTEARNGDIYRVRQSRTILYPTQAGTLTIEPTTFVIPRDAFSPGEVQFTDALTVQVQPLPDAVEAPGFSGLVGQFEVVQTLDRQEANLGEPLKLQLTVRGTGNIEQVPIPEFMPTDTWRIYANPGDYLITETDDGRIVGEKTFEWLLTPVEVGQYEIPEIIFSYFDLTTLQYQPVILTPITIDVRGDLNVIAPDPTPFAKIDVPVMRPIVASFTFNGPLSGLVNVLFIALWIVPPVTTLAIWRRLHNAHLRAQNKAYYRRSEALQQAQHTLANARKQSGPMGYQLVQTAIMTFFADKLDLQASGLHYTDITDAMRLYNIEPFVAEAILGCLHDVDEALYMTATESDTSTLVEQAAQLLTEIDTYWAGK